MGAEVRRRAAEKQQPPRPSGKGPCDPVARHAEPGDHDQRVALLRADTDTTAAATTRQVPISHKGNAQIHDTSFSVPSTCLAPVILINPNGLAFLYRTGWLAGLVAAQTHRWSGHRRGGRSLTENQKSWERFWHSQQSLTMSPRRHGYSPFPLATRGSARWMRVAPAPAASRSPQPMPQRAYLPATACLTQSPVELQSGGWYTPPGTPPMQSTRRPSGPDDRTLVVPASTRTR